MPVYDMKPVLRLTVEFDKGRAWEHSIALNGWNPTRFLVDGAELVLRPSSDEDYGWMGD